MLVLSRRPKQQITFPTLDITIEIVRVEGSTVRVGVSAPPSVPVLRGELDNHPGSREAAHRLRGQFNTATLALTLAQRQLQVGRSADAEQTLAEALGVLARLEEDVAGVPPDRQPRRIKALLVEDNQHESALLRSCLQLYGVEVDNASDGVEALEYLAGNHRADAVLLDMRMPRFDGPSTVAAIRANPANDCLKVFAVTGSRPDEMSVAGGIDGWFTKPLDPARLVEALERAVVR